ncbi:hypothetical protein AN958_07088 [Leucoagaricus sp. SymC.cos]|nr:hypothetical protein AN958_07088 [Leucoagaricus sp. SymC.cos]
MSSEAAAFTRQYLNAAGLSLLVYEQFITWETEFQSIWRSSPWNVKLTFFIARYFSLGAQIANLIYSTPVFIRRQNGNCLPWFKLKFQTGSVMLLMWNLEAIMMVRVYALYGRKLWIGALLIFWFACCRASDVWFWTVGNDQLKLDMYCILTQVSATSRWMSLLVVINQTILWFLSYRKYRTAVRDQWIEQSPVLRTVIRDNSWTLLVLFGND